MSLYAFFVEVAGNSNREAFGRAFREHLAREGFADGKKKRLLDAA